MLHNDGSFMTAACSLLFLLCCTLLHTSLGFSRVIWLSEISSSPNKINMTSTRNDHDTPPTNLDFFAIGSMMNPVALANRGIHPISSEPAELLDYRIGFFTSQGYAEAIPEANSSFHGVIHHLTREDMEKLDKIEQLYDRKTATARLYDGTDREVTVYVQSGLNDHSTDAGIPKERYLEIMADGCRHYGVDPKYIDFLENHGKVPRPTPDEYLSFGSAEDCDKTMTLEEVLENDGSDGKPLLMSLNAKVLEVPYARDSTMYQQFQHIFQNMGQVVELFIAKVEYDPKFGCPKCLADVTPEHAAYCEHNHCAYLKMKGSLDEWKIVAKLAPPEN